MYKALFPGQGSQQAGMAVRLCSAFRRARDVFEQSSEALGFDLLATCQDEGRLAETRFAQPALLATSVAAFRCLDEAVGEAPALGAGHSLGEISALTCAGVFDLADAVRLVQRRGELMQEAVPVGRGAMAAVFGLSPEVVERECAAASAGDGPVVVANVNSREQSVISGAAEAVRRACDRLKAAGGFPHPLPISIPAHSPLMSPAAAGFAEALAAVEVRAPAWPVLSGRTAEAYRADTDVRSELVAQLTWPVRWRQVMSAVAESGAAISVEIGPRTVLRDLIRMEWPGLIALSFGVPEELDAIRSALGAAAGVARERDGADFPAERFLARCLAVAAGAPNRNFDPGKHALAVARPYQRLQELRRSAAGAGDPVRIAREGAELLRQVLRGKKLSEPERAERLTSLLRETRAFALFPDLHP